MLTHDEVLLSGFQGWWECAIAYEDGVLISIYFHTAQWQGASCDNCTFTCHTGNTPFTREDRRQEGIFNGLYEWVKEQKGYGKVVYQSGDYPHDAEAVFAQFDISMGGVRAGQLIPEGYQDRLPLVIGTFNRIAAQRGLQGIT